MGWKEWGVEGRVGLHSEVQTEITLSLVFVRLAFKSCFCPIDFGSGAAGR